MTQEYDLTAITAAMMSWSGPSPGQAHRFLATMHRPEALQRGEFEDHFFLSPSMSNELIARWPVADQPHMHDLFFAPLAFRTPERKNETVVKPGVLYADLDRVHPQRMPAGIPRPTVAWETSPGNYQALWRLHRRYDNYAEWSDLNRRLTAATHADPGGWMGSKLLRVPGSTNWKRRASGRLLWYIPELIYDAAGMELPELSNQAGHDAHVGDDYPTPLAEVKDRDWLIGLYWSRMTLLGRHMITKRSPMDRSLHIVRTASELMRGGLNAGETFVLLWVAPFNKWRTDRWMPEQLWAEVQRAAAK